jgi:PKD repeat protein
MLKRSDKYADLYRHFRIPVLVALLCSFPGEGIEAHEEAVHRNIALNAVSLYDDPFFRLYRWEIGNGAYHEDAIPNWCYHGYNPMNQHGFGWYDWEGLETRGWFRPGCAFILTPWDVGLEFLLWMGVEEDDKGPDNRLDATFDGVWTAHEAIDILWGRAIDQYNRGNFQGRNGAFHLLGRCIHLVQDMTSPAHVHNDEHGDGDDFEGWGGRFGRLGPNDNFEELTTLIGQPPVNISPQQYLHDTAMLTYSKTTYPGNIFEHPEIAQPESQLKSMFPTLHFVGGGVFDDNQWVIDNVGTYGNETIEGSWEWWASLDDYEVDDSGPLDSWDWDTIRVRGNFYIENSAGDDNQLVPATWDGEPNDRTLMEIYGEELYPIAVSRSAGLLKLFKDAVCTPPTVDFEIDNEFLDCAPFTVRFRDLSEPSRDNDPLAAITRWHWDFGDGSTSDEQHPEHVYAAQGFYDVSLDVWDAMSCEGYGGRKDFVRVLPGRPSYDENDERIDGVCHQEKIFYRGDSNDDGAIDISDPVHILRYLFMEGDRPPCRDSSDADDDGELDLNDAVFLLDFIFRDSIEPPPPGPPPFGIKLVSRDCGPDFTEDALDCQLYTHCIGGEVPGEPVEPELLPPPIRIPDPGPIDPLEQIDENELPGWQVFEGIDLNLDPGIDPGVGPIIGPGVDPGVDLGVDPGVDPEVNPGVAPKVNLPD